MPKGKQPSKMRRGTQPIKKRAGTKHKKIRKSSTTGIKTALYGGMTIPERSVFTIGSRLK